MMMMMSAACRRYFSSIDETECRCVFARMREGVVTLYWAPYWAAVNMVLQYGWCDSAIVCTSLWHPYLQDVPFLSLFYFNAQPICWGLTHILPGDPMRVRRKLLKPFKPKKKVTSCCLGSKNLKPGSLSGFLALCICAESSLLFPFVPSACFF